MDIRFGRESGREAFTGNELILKGALEGGVGLITGYPGSPVSEVFDAVGRSAELLRSHGIVAQLANNEGLAAARLNGARLAGVRGLAIMKSVGMHVAADGLAIGNLMETRRPEGGALVVVGDDPWNETTQINSDSRYLSVHLNMPLLEPSSFQELKDWIRDGFELSGASDLYLTYLVTTNQADGGAAVTCRSNQYPPVNALAPKVMSSAEMTISDTVMIPPHTSWREATLAERRGRLLSLVRQRPLNKKFFPAGVNRAPVGFVSAGLSAAYLSQALAELGLEGRVPVLKWGLTYPLDEELLLDFARRVDHLYVVEEKRDFLESQMVRHLQQAVQEGKLPKMPAVWGKQFPDGHLGFPAVRGLNSSLVVERLAPLLLSGLLKVEADLAQVKEVLERIKDTAQSATPLPVRTPTFCPGCPHRDSAAVTKALKRDFADPRYMRTQHKEDPVDVIFHGESGCHSMLQFEPNVGLMQDYSGMGLGGGTGSGIDPFITNKQVVFLGDSTFFHSGMIAVSDSIKNNQDITYIILDNKTTAMTGHQPTPGTEQDVLFNHTFAQDIELVIRGMAKDKVPIYRVNPAYRESYRELLEDVVREPGVKVVIADKECGITYQRRLRREKKKIMREQGFLPEEKVINITPEVCEFCLECTNATGCPGLTVEETLHGPKIVTDKSLCVADGACLKGKVCPSFEEITIRRTRPPLRPQVPQGLPAAPVQARLEEWYCYSAGVGGMGLGVLTGILVEAGLLEGYEVIFADKKGLAIRNGGVFGHVVFTREKREMAPLIPYGRADLLLGIDLLEAARGVDPHMNLRVASAKKTVAIVNTHKMPTIMGLLGRQDFKVEDLEKRLREKTRPGYFGIDVSAISEGYFGTKLYANVLLLGVAFQRGEIPVSWENLTKAVGLIIPSAEREDNLLALRLGRWVAATPEKFSTWAPRRPSYEEVLEEKTKILSRGLFRSGRGAQYRKMVQEAVRWIDIGDRDHARLAQFVYDLFCYGGAAYAGRYLKRLWSLHQKDLSEQGFQLTRAAMEQLHRVMLIKDEVYVAHLLTAVEKRRRDFSRYNIDPRRGDRVSIRHFNRPRFPLGPWNVEFDLVSRDWMLTLMRYGGFLRNLLPRWHKAERDFRNWYEQLVDQHQWTSEEGAYQRALTLFRLPAEVRGYREVREKAMTAALERAALLKAEVPAPAVTLKPLPKGH